MFENFSIDMLGFIAAFVIGWACSEESKNSAAAETTTTNSNE